PGIELDHVERIDEREWQVAHTLTVDLSEHRVGYLDPGAIAATAPLTAAADRAGAVAAINGDFYDINNSGAPVGAAFADGELLKSPSGDRTRAMAFGSDGIGRIVDVRFQGTVTTPGGEHPLSRLNSHDLPTDGIGAYTARWGTYTRGRAVLGAARVTEVLVEDGVVEKVTPAAGDGAIPSDAVVLLGREAGADTLARLRPGDPVSVDYSADASDGKDVRALVGGGALLVRDGEVQDVDDSGPPFPARTGVGFSEDGRTMILVSVDGPNASHSRGGSLKELARLLVERGAHTGMELDGGGSSTLLARTPGSDHVEVENVPNDGHVRAVSNGLGIFPRTAGSGQVRGLHVTPAIDAGRAATHAIVANGRPDRVFTGLTRSMSATAHDELLGPVAQQPTVRWTATGGRMDGSTFRATRPGTATVRARAGVASGRTSLRVLQPPVRIDTTAAAVNLAGPDETGTIAVLGFDAHGNSAPIEPRDIAVEYDDSTFALTPNQDGGFDVRAKKDSGAGLVTLKVGDLSTSIAVGIGVERHVVSTFDDAEQWAVGGARSTQTREQVADGGHDGAALRLAYDFTTCTATRTAYVTAPEWLGKPGKTRSVGLMVHGHGRGEWTAFRVRDGEGNTTNLYGPYITWNGWQEVEVEIPDGMPQPVQVDRFTAIEIDAGKQYEGELLIDDLFVKVAPAIEEPPAEQVRDRLVDSTGRVAGSNWRFAVMSDAQFVAREPDSPLVEAARRTLREVKATDAEFVVINGDLVDEGSVADFALAKRILDEELGGELPYYYVPGNHEIMGGPIDNFRAAFGATHRTFDHRGTRFITLDTSTGSLQGGGFDQIAMLRSALDGAARDRRIHSVVVLQHHPTRDPSVNAVSQLPHRHDAHLI
ncbi:MAG TPA: phosphodiester glycosidase family protein, partial [Actinopolymorphaceae bacterium]